MALSQVDYAFQGYNRGDKFMVAKYSFKGLVVQHPAIIEDLLPQPPAPILEAIKITVLEHEYASTNRTGI